MRTVVVPRTSTSSHGPNWDTVNGGPYKVIRPAIPNSKYHEKQILSGRVQHSPTPGLASLELSMLTAIIDGRVSLATSLSYV